MKRLNLGVIGIGRMGRIRCASIASQIPAARIRTISDFAADGLEEYARSLEIPAVTDDYKTILEDREIDAVLVCTPTATHVDIAIQALKAGKHVFCEKPVDFDMAKIRKLDEVWKSTDRKLQIGFNRRFDHNFARIRENIISGAVGDVHVIKIVSRDPAPPPLSYIATSGGMFFDMSIHDFDLARFLSGSPVLEVYAAASVLVNPDIGKAGDVDTAVVVLKFENGSLGVIDNSRQAVYGYDQRVEVFGSKGLTLTQNDLPTQVQVWNSESIHSDKPLYFFLERHMNAYIEEMRQFVDAVLFDKPVPVSLDDAIMANLIAMAVQRSVAEGRQVRLAEIADDQHPGRAGITAPRCL